MQRETIEGDITELGMGEIEVVRALFLDIFTGEPWNDVWPEDCLRDYLSELLGAPTALSFGLWEGKTLVGLALGRRRTWQTGPEFWMEEFGVSPRLQGRGIGGAFLRAIERRVATQGLTHLILLTSREVPAFRFYQRLGYEPIGHTVCLVKALEGQGRTAP